MASARQAFTGLSGGGMLPTFLIIGGQKCGTTSLHHHLVEHPQIGVPRRKEVHYFDLRFTRGEAWYRSHFPMRGSCRHTLDSSPYYLFHPAVPQRVHGLLPDVKLIVLLRDPVQRAYSHYQHSRALGLETLDFGAAIAAEEKRLEGTVDLLLSDPTASSSSHQHHSYVARSIYAPQIRRWREYFDPEQMLILQSEALFADPGAVVERVQRWLEIPVHVPADLEPMNTRAYTTLDAPVAHALAQRFARDRLELQQLTGMTFDWDVPPVQA